MLSTFKQEQGKWVFAQVSEADDIPIGNLIDAVIDPDTGKIRAWWVRSLEGLQIISLSDIIRWNQELIMVHSEQDLRNPTQLPRLEKVLEREVRILKAPVFTETQALGRVVDFAFQTTNPRIISIMVRKGWWLFGKTRTIPAKHIQRITAEGILVHDLLSTRSKDSLPNLPTKATPEAD